VVLGETEKSVHVIRDRPNDDGRTLPVGEDSGHIAMEFGTDCGLKKRGTVLGAEDQVDQVPY
jgi:hypothetical protein